MLNARHRHSLMHQPPYQFLSESGLMRGSMRMIETHPLTKMDLKQFNDLFLRVIEYFFPMLAFVVMSGVTFRS